MQLRFLPGFLRNNSRYYTIDKEISFFYIVNSFQKFHDGSKWLRPSTFATTVTSDNMITISNNEEKEDDNNK
jgi:hypothetical protein